jgi:hypothetical protein
VLTHLIGFITNLAYFARLSVERWNGAGSRGDSVKFVSLIRAFSRKFAAIRVLPCSNLTRRVRVAPNQVGTR